MKLLGLGAWAVPEDKNTGLSFLLIDSWLISGNKGAASNLWDFGFYQKLFFFFFPAKGEPQLLAGWNYRRKDRREKEQGKQEENQNSQISSGPFSLSNTQGFLSKIRSGEEDCPTLEKVRFIFVWLLLLP